MNLKCGKKKDCEKCEKKEDCARGECVGGMCVRGKRPKWVGWCEKRKKKKCCDDE